MRGTRTIRRAGLAASLGALLALPGLLALLAGCEEARRRVERRETSSMQQLPGLASARLGERAFGAESAAPLPSAVAQTLRSVREQRLDISAPRVPPQRLAFGAGRLLQASEGKVLFRETKQGEVIADANTGSVRAVAAGSDGALFALGATNGVRLELRTATPKPFQHAAFFPGSLLFGDLESPEFFHVFYPVESQFYRYPFQSDGAYPMIESQFPLADCVGPPALLRDGAFVCRTAHGLARKAPRGRRTDLNTSLDLATHFRLLPAKRLDEVFSISDQGEVLHLRLVPGLPVLSRFQLPARPYAVAANAEALAFVLVSPAGPGQGRRWALLVSDFEGQPRFRVELPSKSAAADDGWLAAVVEDKNLAISAFEPLVAVGGAARVTVWDLLQGRQLFVR